MFNTDIPMFPNKIYVNMDVPFDVSTVLYCYVDNSQAYK